MLKKIGITIFYTLFFITVLSLNLNITNISSISYVLILIVSIFTSFELNIIFLFCIIPFQRLFLFSPDFMTLVPLLELLIIFKYLLRIKIKKSIFNQMLFCLILLIYSSSIEILRFSSFDNSLKFIITIICLVVISDSQNLKLSKQCLMYFSVSALLSSVIGYFFPVVSSFTALYTSEYTFRFQGLMGDPGEFGQTMVSSIAIIVMLIFMNEDKPYSFKYYFKIFCYILSVFVFLISIILSGTRACLIALGVIYLFSMYWIFSKKKKKNILIGILLSIVSIIFIAALGNVFIETLFSTHGGEAISDDNRFIIWKSYWDMYKSNPSILIFGVGMDNANLFGQTYGLGNPHNFIIEKLTESGFIGLILNLLIFIPIIRKKNMAISNYLTLPFYAFLSTLLVYGSVGIVLPYLLLSLINNKENKKEVYFKSKNSL